MDRRTFALATAASTILQLPSARAVPPLLPMLLGAQTHFAQGWALDVLDQAKAAGLPITFVRDEMFWKNVERSQGVLDSTEYDPYADALKAKGIKLLLELFNANPLYDQESISTIRSSAGRICALCRISVQRYGDNLVAVELWNEPNGSFGYGLKAADLVAPYASLAQKVYAAVKAVRTDVPVLVGASTLVAMQWHKRLVAAGILTACDGVSFHPYQNADAVEAKLKELRGIVGNKQLWSTKSGS